MSDFLLPVIEELSKKFLFDFKKALIFIGLRNIKCIFPFSGKIKRGCRAVCWSYGLHTQCGCEVVKNEIYCFKCRKKKKNGKLIGDIGDRLKCRLLDYVDARGRKTIPWINYIKEKNLDFDLCLRAAKDTGVFISKEHLEKKVMRRGRPKKKIIKEEFIYNTCDILGTDFSEEILELYGNTNTAIDNFGNVYDLYDFGAVKRIK